MANLFYPQFTLEHEGIKSSNFIVFISIQQDSGSVLLITGADTQSEPDKSQYLITKQDLGFLVLL